MIPYDSSPGLCSLIRRNDIIGLKVSFISSDWNRTNTHSVKEPVCIVLIFAANAQFGIGLFALLIHDSSLDLLAFRSLFPLWGAVFFIIAGSLSIIAQARPNIGLVRGSLTFTIAVSIISVTEILLHCVDFQSISCTYDFDGYYEEYESCLILQSEFLRLFSGLIMINLLAFSICISIAVFAYRAVAQNTTNVPQAFVLQNGVAFSLEPPPYHALSPSASPPPP
ncbi:membrane-spanning 4-domains subfamily A member 4A-like isoform X2 [Dendropsophus ebraccatus]|uniref:membrane-spanning 4-domains subfamily A member 4A-like isoform X2 n=1 Tax=Dendropsophus ebraccatus TaxID=150705 RepID=UPI003831F2DB